MRQFAAESTSDGLQQIASPSHDLVSYRTQFLFHIHLCKLINLNGCNIQFTLDYARWESVSQILWYIIEQLVGILCRYPILGLEDSNRISVCLFTLLAFVTSNIFFFPLPVAYLSHSLDFFIFALETFYTTLKCSSQCGCNSFWSSVFLNYCSYPIPSQSNIKLK